jgi:hypothetical protein
MGKDFRRSRKFIKLGLNGFEPLTSSLSVTRSNQLSYKPSTAATFIALAGGVEESFMVAAGGPDVKCSSKLRRRKGLKQFLPKGQDV